MTADQPPPPAAVQIVRDALRVRGYLTTIDNVEAPGVVAALAERYAFVGHAEYAALKAVAEAAREHLDWVENIKRHDALVTALRALDAAPTRTTAEGKAEGDPPSPGVGLPILCP